MLDNENMSEYFHRPVWRGGSFFEQYFGAQDPQEMFAFAHESAEALLARVRDQKQHDIVEALVSYMDIHGVDDIASLWGQADSISLPGLLWRMYLVRGAICENPDESRLWFERGLSVCDTSAPVIVGIDQPVSAERIVRFANEMLRGVFAGDIADAVYRASSFCHISSLGCANFFHDAPEHESALRAKWQTRSERFARLAQELEACERMWRMRFSAT